MRPTPRPPIKNYEDGLATLFRKGSADLRHMALAHRGGFADRLPDWIASNAEGADSQARDGEQLRLLQALTTGDIGRIETEFGRIDTPDRDLPSPSSRRTIPSNSGRLDQLLVYAIEPLILLGKAELLPQLHARSLDRLGVGAQSTMTAFAAHALAASGDWPQALQILERARATRDNIQVPLDLEGLLWKYAYLHRQVATAMPVLATIPFRMDLPHLVAGRTWWLKMYQIRSGMRGVDVPVIEGEQPFDYGRAAAMQIAALQDDPSSQQYVEDLRRALRPRNIEMSVPQRGIAVTVTDETPRFSTAETQIAANRKNYAKLATIARIKVPKNVLLDPPGTVIEALLDESDWRGAADIAKDHDPRTKPLIAGFDDTRADDYVQLYRRLAVTAARQGNEAAATELLNMSEDGGLYNRSLLLETLFAGVAEGHVPRGSLHVLSPAFVTSY